MRVNVATGLLQAKATSGPEEHSHSTFLTQDSLTKCVGENKPTIHTFAHCESCLLCVLYRNFTLQ